MEFIYHVTTEAEWAAAKEKGYYTAPSLATEGFIHASKEHQVAGVLERFYKGKANLVKLIIDPQQLEHPLKYELAPSVQEEFPHIYGPLNVSAVVETRPL